METVVIGPSCNQTKSIQHYQCQEPDTNFRASTGHKSQGVQMQKWESAFYMYLPPLLHTEMVAPPKQKVGTHHPMKEQAFPSRA